MKKYTIPPQWDEMRANSRDQLITMMKDLEIPYSQQFTTGQLRLILQTYLEKPSEFKQSVSNLYTKERYKKRHLKIILALKISFFLIFSFIILQFLWRFIIHPPYCTSNNMQKYLFRQCMECPSFAKCTKSKAKCLKSTDFLTSIGCRPKSHKNQYRLALYAARYIHFHDGNCFEPYKSISIEQFSKLFPRVNTSLYETDPYFNIKILNISGSNQSELYIKSLNPHSGLLCKSLKTAEENPTFMGILIFTIAFLIFYRRYKRKHNKNMTIARELAKQAHKILATSDKQIYMYDIKVQLRANMEKLIQFGNML